MEHFIEKGILTADQINSVMEYMTGKPCGTAVAFEGQHGEQFTAYNDNQGETWFCCPPRNGNLTNRGHDND